MSNVKHKNCIVRQLAKSAKSRLCKNDYEQEVAPTGATPEQRPNKKKYISNFANCKKTVKR